MILVLVVLFAVGIPTALVAAGKLPPSAVIPVVGPPLLFLAVARPRWILLLLVAVQVSNAGAVLSGHGVPGVSAGVILLAAMALIVGRLRSTISPSWSPAYLTAAVLWAALAVTVLVTRDQQAALAKLAEIGTALAVLVLVASLADNPKTIRSAVVVAVGTVATLAALSVVQEFVLANKGNLGGLSNVPKVADLAGATARHSGPVTDANFWGRTLVLFVPVALSCVVAPGFRRSRWFWAPAALAVFGGIYLTQSRGAMLAAFLATTTWLALAGRRSRRLLLVAPLVVLALLAIPGVGSRLQTLTQVASDPDTADPSLTGRRDVLEIGTQMVLDHPVTGVGVGNFQAVEPDYLRRYGTRSIVGARVLAPHNTYLEMAAEGGLVGLAAWVLFYGTALMLSLRAFLAFDDGHPDGASNRLLAGGILAGLVGWGFASVFLHLADFRTLMVVVGLGVALDAAAKSAGAHSRAPVARRSVPRTAREWFVRSLWISASSTRSGITIIALRRNSPTVIAAGVFMIVWTAAMLVSSPPSSLWEATAAAEVRPAGPAASPYEGDLLTRRIIVPTFAAVASNSRFRQEAEQQLGLGMAQRQTLEIRARRATASAVIRISARSPDEATAIAAAQATLDRAADYIASLETLFVLNRLPTAPSVEQVRASRARSMLVGVPLATAAALTAYGGVAVQRRRRSIPSGTSGTGAS